MPDQGESTPIIWGNRIFIQTAVPTDDDSADSDMPWRFGVICLDRNTGDTLWDRTVREEVPHEGHHMSASFSSFSPVTDGELVWANFGSRGLHCFDVDGKHQWSVDLPEMTKMKKLGEGSSPVLVNDNLIIVRDHEGDSKIIAFNKRTGTVNWETDRAEGTTWATPLPITVDGKVQVVATGFEVIRSYDAMTGGLIWEYGIHLGPSSSTATPVASARNVFCPSGDHRSVLTAIELGRTGDLTDSDAVSWQIREGSPYVPSPLLYEENIYFLKGTKPNLSCYRADTGEPLYIEQRLEGMRDVYASPTGAAGRIYIADRFGTVSVIKHGDTLEVLATNTLDEGFDASPVIVGDELYLKGENHLYCIAETGGDK